MSPRSTILYKLCRHLNAACLMLSAGYYRATQATVLSATLLTLLAVVCGYLIHCTRAYARNKCLARIQAAFIFIARMHMHMHLRYSLQSSLALLLSFSLAYWT